MGAEDFDRSPGVCVTRHFRTRLMRVISAAGQHGHDRRRRSRMGRWAAVSVAAVLCMAGLSACGSDVSGAGGPATAGGALTIQGDAGSPNLI